MVTFRCQVLIGLSLFVSMLSLTAQTESNDGLQVEKLEQYKDASFTHLSFNVSPLLFELIPLKQSPTKSGPIGLAYAWGYDRHAFRFGLGLNLNSETGDSRALLRVGYENNKLISKRMRYYSSYDFWLGGGGFNVPNESNFDGSIAGFAMGLGFQYFIHPMVYLGSESNLFLGFADGVALNIIPPVGVFLGVKI